MSGEHNGFVRKTVSLPQDVWQRVEDYQFQHRIKRDSEAIRRLVVAGLNATEKNKQPSKSRADRDPKIR